MRNLSTMGFYQPLPTQPNVALVYDSASRQNRNKWSTVGGNPLPTFEPGGKTILYRTSATATDSMGILTLGANDGIRYRSFYWIYFAIAYSFSTTLLYVWSTYNTFNVVYSAGAGYVGNTAHNTIGAGDANNELRISFTSSGTLPTTLALARLVVTHVTELDSFRR